MFGHGRSGPKFHISVSVTAKFNDPTLSSVGKNCDMLETCKKSL